MKKTIVCYGDSNTWGYQPGTGARFDETIRWPGRLKRLLGEEYCIIEAGLTGRTTSFDDPYKDYLNGKRGLPYCLVSAKPIDLLVISLGTNDLKYGNVYRSAQGLATLLDIACGTHAYMPSRAPVFADTTKILVISPIHLGAELDERFPDSEFVGREKDSHMFSQQYKRVCDQYHVEFLDAALYASASQADCIHMDASSHALLATAVVRAIQDILDRPPAEAALEL